MFTLDLAGKTGLVLGVANHRSLAWAISQQLHAAGARLAFAHAGERLKEKVDALTSTMAGAPLFPCDVTRDEEVEGLFRNAVETLGRLDFLVHSVAFANKEDLEGDFINTTRAGFHLAMD